MSSRNPLTPSVPYGWLLWSAAAALFGACGDSDVDEPRLTLESGDGTAPAPEEKDRSVNLGRSFVDSGGRTWRQTQKVTYSTREPIEPKDERAAAPDSELDVANASTETVKAQLYSLMEFGGYEYVLSEADATKGAKALQAAVRNAPGIPSAPSSRPSRSSRNPGNKLIIGADDRENFNFFAATWPEVLIANLADNNVSNCTAFKMLNEFTMVTAAHCIYDTVSNDWYPPHTIQLGAGANTTASGGQGGALPKIPKDCYLRFVPQGWKNARSNTASEQYDYAILRLRGNGAWCDEASYSVGWFGYQGSTNGESNLSLALTGYPNPVPAGVQWPTLMYHFCAACAWAPSTSYSLRYTNDATSGQSGSPVYIYWWPDDDYRARAVHSGGSTSGTYNVGPRVTWTMINWMMTEQGS